MTRKDYQRELEIATPVLREITSGNRCRFEAKRILSDCDLNIVNTVELLMIIGRQAHYDRRKKPFKDPVGELQSWDKYLTHSGYANSNKEQKIAYITGKVSLITFLETSMKLLLIS